MEKADVRKELAIRINASLASEEPLPKSLRPYQRETLVSAVTWLEDRQGTDRAYVQHATGLGKTILFATIARFCPGLRVLVIVPSKVLIAQTARVLAPYVGGMVGHLSSLGDVLDKNGQVVATYGHHDHSVVVTTDATLKSSAADIAKDFGPHLIIRDECHWGYSDLSKDALGHFPNAAIIGFSATPDYLSTVAKPNYVPVELEHGQVLYGDPNRFARAHFGTCLDVRTARWGMENGYLCPLVWGNITFAKSLDRIPIHDGPGGMDYDEGALQKFMRESWPTTCETIRRLYEDPDLKLSERQVFAVCPGVAQAQQMAEVIASIKIPAHAITGNTDTDERESILAAFERREVPFLSSVQVLREGWDSPVADTGLMLRPTRSRTYYEQGFGRLLRLSEEHPDKTALAVDLFFQNTRFAPLCAPLIYGKPGEIMKPREPIVSNTKGFVTDVKRLTNLPEYLVPKLNVVHTQAIEFWADEDNAFKADGLVWVSLLGIATLYGGGISDVTRPIYTSKNRIRARKAKDKDKRICDFFCLDDIIDVMGRKPKRMPSCY